MCHGWKGTAMGSPNPVIINVTTPEFKKVVVEASDGVRYYSDLSVLSLVYCYPKDSAEWDKVYADSFGTALIWTSRFEVHMDQVIGLAYKTEKIARSA
jgi:hypothetical protein